MAAGDPFAGCRKAIETNYKTTALVLQGGGALGAYQAGVAEVLHDDKIDIDWVAGISIGAGDHLHVCGFFLHYWQKCSVSDLYERTH